MINQDFIRETDAIINQLFERQIRFEHGNVLVAKVKMERVTPGGVIISDDYAAQEEFKSGFARILALPSGYDGLLTIGQYVIFSHEARYKLYPAALREVLGMNVADNFLYTVQDNNIILTIEGGKLYETQNNSSL